MNKKHIPSIRLYLDDLAETDQPWERWEYNASGKWKPLEGNPQWNFSVQYRRKPERIQKEVSFQKPESEVPPLGTQFFYPNSGYPARVMMGIWTGDASDFGLLNSGLVHLSREAAKEHLDAILSVSKPFEK